MHIGSQRTSKIIENIGDLTLCGQTCPATLAVTSNGPKAEHPIDKVAKVGLSARGKCLDFAQGTLSDG